MGLEGVNRGVLHAGGGKESEPEAAMHFNGSCAALAFNDFWTKQSHPCNGLTCDPYRSVQGRKCTLFGP